MFLIPNNILDKLVCNYCFKFLSATPVKIFPGGKLKCGRCSSKEDGGVLSLYNSIAENSIFKCVNRFDGCKELLTPSDVLKHEEICKSNEYICPICCEFIPTYLMRSHFQLVHRDNILQNPHFVVTKLIKTRHSFLYQNEKNLFFLTLELLSGTDLKNINICCSYLGELESDKCCTVKFNITCGNILIERQSLCKLYPSFSEETINLNITDQKFLTVMFCIQYPKSEKLTVITLPQKKLLPLLHSEQVSNEEKVEYFLGLKLSTFYFHQREISLSNEFKKSFPDVTVIKGSTISCSVSNEKVHITFSCIVCSCVTKVISDNNIYFANHNGTYYSYCIACSKSLKRPSEKMFSSANLDQIFYFCLWECGKQFNITNLKQHEENCENQPPQICPVNLCKIYLKIFEMNKHFQYKHSNLVVPQLSDIYGSSTPVKLDPYYSPIQRFILVSCVYICVEFNWKHPVWNISLSCKVPNVKPKALIITPVEQTFKYLIEEKGSIPYMDDLLIKCYLAHPDR